jgi:hypothetical protein
MPDGWGPRPASGSVPAGGPGGFVAVQGLVKPTNAFLAIKPAPFVSFVLFCPVV